MTKKVFPSQERYLESHPTISFRLTRENKAKLDAIIKATGKPVSRFMTDFIRQKMAPYKDSSELQAIITRLEDEIKELKKEQKFVVPCVYCGKLLTLSSKQPNWATKIAPKLIETFRKCCPGSCQPK